MKRKTPEAYVPRPIDHIPDGSGSHAAQLAALTAEQLADQTLFYEERMNASEGRTRWEWSKLLSSAHQCRSSAPA